MENEIQLVTQCLKNLFASASDIFVDPKTKECEVKISVEDFRGDITEQLFDSGYGFRMIDYWDNLPFKYIFEYRKIK
jgi:hypothetical protein